MRQFHHIILFTFLFSWFSPKAQEPSYQIIGEDFLSGIDVYSIFESKNRDIWMTSNRGIIKYDGYDFTLINSSHLKALSSFGLIEDEKGELFCFNLFGQILKIKNDSIIVYVQLPDSLVFNSYYLSTTKDHGLLLSSLKTILIDKEKNISVIQINRPPRVASSFTQGAQQCFPLREKEPSNEFWVPNTFSIHEWDGNQYDEFIFSRLHIPNETFPNLIYRTVNNEHIFSTRKGGAYVFDSLNKPKYFGNSIFNRYFISGFLEDYEGNLWYTTIGKGILLVKNNKILSYKSHPLLRNENIIISKFDSKGAIFLGSESGKVFRIDRRGEIEEVFSNGSSLIFVLNFYNDNLISNGGLTLECINMETSISKTIAAVPAIKDAQITEDSLYIIATSHGVYIYKIGVKNSFELSKVYNFGRTNSVNYNSESKVLFASTVKGLFYIKNEISRELKLNGNKIVSTTLTGDDIHSYVGTTADGILVFEDDQFIKQINIESGLLSNRILKVKKFNNLLFISHFKGFQVLDLQTNEFLYPFISNAINGSRISDFDVYQNELIIVSNKDLQTFKLSDLKPNSTIPFLELEAVHVNQSKIDFSSINSFDYDQNKFEFHFKAKAHSHFGKLKYYYRLIGTESEWQESDFNDNEIKYASLNPGKYSFEVKAINENGVESETIVYHFEISIPFWQSMWFYFLVFLTFISITAIVWKVQFDRIKKKNRKENELLGSKLTALKLQMNPHFIFNSLNSIQDLILKEDTENSYDYIVKFSNLVRMTLNFSDKDLISLEEEVEMLQLYLELENLRFKKDFHFSIENKVDSELKIPSMLIQPFVENSIKHGLLHKAGMKEVKISFYLKEVIYCVIEDNGIGIEKSQEINQRKKGKHQSISTESISKRIDILKKYYNSELGLEILNLENENGESSGTKVIIRIPFEHQ